jgi:ribosomal protein S7
MPKTLQAIIGNRIKSEVSTPSKTSNLREAQANALSVSSAYRYIPTGADSEAKKDVAAEVAQMILDASAKSDVAVMLMAIPPT